MVQGQQDTESEYGTASEGEAEETFESVENARAEDSDDAVDVSGLLKHWGHGAQDKRRKKKRHESTVGFSYAPPPPPPPIELPFLTLRQTFPPFLSMWHKEAPPPPLPKELGPLFHCA